MYFVTCLVININCCVLEYPLNFYMHYFEMPSESSVKLFRLCFFLIGTRHEKQTYNMKTFVCVYVMDVLWDSNTRRKCDVLQVCKSTHS